MKRFIFCITLLSSISCTGDEDWERVWAFVNEYYVVLKQKDCERLLGEYLSNRYRGPLTIESYCESIAHIHELLGEVVKRRPVKWSSVARVGDNEHVYRIDYEVEYFKGVGRVSIIVIKSNNNLKIDEHRVDSPLLKRNSL